MDNVRLIVEGINRNLRENYPMYTGEVDNSTETEREIVNLSALYDFMMERGFNELPDSTTEKKSLIDVVSRLQDLGVNLDDPKEVETPEFPGEFEE